MDNFVFLPEITDKYIPIEKVRLHWILPDESSVNKGDIIMEVVTNPGNTYPVVAHRSGMFIRFWNEDVNIEKTKYKSKEFKIADAPKVCIGGIYDSYENFITSLFKYQENVVVDSFTNEKTISWVYVAESIINFPFIHICFNSFNDLKLSKNNLNRKDVSLGIGAFRKVITISYSPSIGISFSFVFCEGNSYIEFTYSQDNIKLKKNDSISFLYENGNISDFKLLNNPYKKSEKSQTRCIRCQLYADDIENLTSSLISKWRISFADDQKPPITGNVVSEKDNAKVPCSLVLGYYKREKRTPYLIQNYTKYYIKVLKKEVPDYEHPSKEYGGGRSENNSYSFDWCYVYLMKDQTNNYYKIGYSKTPEYRERTLQSEKPTIEMICHKRLPSRKMADAFEKALHNAFADKRIRGEWFNLDDNDVAQIMESLK